MYKRLSAQTPARPPPVAPSPADQESVRQLLPELPPYLERSLEKLRNDPDFGGRVLTAVEKQAVCRAYVRTASIDKTCEAVGINPPLLYRHLELDPDFQAAFSLAKLSLGDKIQTVSVKRALHPMGVVDRMCQLKRFFPSVYRESGSQVAVGVSIQFAPHHA